jgi:hypothetical protein
MPAKPAEVAVETGPEAPLEGDGELPEVEAGMELEAGDDATLSLAELEAMGDEEGAEGQGDEIEEEGKGEEPSNFLALYFREMAQLSILRPEEEFESAR